MIKVEGYWISIGDMEPTVDETYVLTSSVKLNLRDIVRVVSAGYVGLQLYLFLSFGNSFISIGENKIITCFLFTRAYFLELWYNSYFFYLIMFLFYRYCKKPKIN